MVIPDELPDVPPQWRRIGVVAPVGQSAAVLCDSLREIGLEADSWADVDQLCEELEGGAAAVFLLQEALSRPDDLQRLAEAMAAQPPWSDLPVHILVRDRRQITRYMSRLSDIGYDRAIILPRPVSRESLHSLAEAALRNRARQYAIHGLCSRLERDNSILQERSDEVDSHTQLMVHDLRSPLSAIIQGLDLLLRFEGPRPEAEKIIHLTRRAAEDLNRFSSDLLQFVQAGAGPLHHVKGEVVDIGPVIDELAVTLRPRGRVSGDPIPPVRAERGLVRRLLGNLIENGLKYNQAAEPRVHVSGTRSGDQVQIDVSDNGIGVPEDPELAIFEPFFRGDRERYSGTGLGLASCRRIVTRLGGEIWARRQPEGGSVFSFTLPAAQDAQ